MKKIVSFAAFLCFVLTALFMGPAGAVAADKPVKISTCWMAESVPFNIWYAKKMGWDKEEGLDIEMLLFDSGPSQMEALPSRAWQLGSTGVGGQLVGGIRYNIVSVAPVVTEGLVHVLYLRPDSPAMQVKGFNPDYPEVYGSPETVKGMTILYTTQTTVHYMVGKWLSILGLSVDDVKLVNMDQPSAVPAFEKGIGDAVCLWAPFTFAAEQRGWPSAGTMADMKCDTVSTLVGDREWCEKNPELVARFLRVFFRASKMIMEEGPTERLAKLHQECMNEFAGVRMDLEENKKDILIHPRFTYEEALALMTPGADSRSQVDKWQQDFAAFFESIGRYSPAEIQKFKDARINDIKYLQMVELPIPDWK